MAKCPKTVSIWLVSTTLLAACDTETASPAPDADTAQTPDVAWDFAPPDKLASQPEPPLLLTEGDGTPVDATRWQASRRAEAWALLQHYVYGRAATDRPVQVLTRSTDVPILDGAARLDQYTLQVDGVQQPLHLAVFRPAGDGPFPVWLAINPCGNHAILADTAIDVSEGWRQPNCPGDTAEAGRGGQSDMFPVAAITAAGHALLAFHQSDIAPDDPAAGLAGWRADLNPGGDEATRWGVLQAWASGVVHVARAVPQLGYLDPQRIAVVGHSRRGKTALLAAAREPSIRLVVAHQSGTAGARLSRSEVGEPVSAIATLFPHWFGGHFASFADRETYLPFDQHFLLALVAPRPLLLGNGASDTWADPDGTRAAATLASPVWTLLGSTGLGADNDLSARFAFYLRPGGHALGSADWTAFLQFAQGKL